MAQDSAAENGLEESIERYHQRLQREPANNLYETVGFVAEWIKKMPPDHREIFETAIISKYLVHEWNDAYAVILCGDAKIQSAAPTLHKMLSANLTRDPNADINIDLVMSLGSLKYAPAYRTIEQFFIDSEHEFVALEALARIDFNRSVQHINRAFNRQYWSWKRSSEGQLKQRLMFIFASLFNDAKPQGALDLLSGSAQEIKLDPYFVKDAFAEAFEHYWTKDGRRVVFPKRAHYFIKQVTRILTGKQLPRHSK